jgi:hypothetical protein
METPCWPCLTHYSPVRRYTVVYVAAQQGNAVDAFGPEPVRVSDVGVGLGATDCCRSPAV